MNVIQNADVNKLANIIRHGVNAREAGLWEFRFKGKPEGSPAATRYPNLLAEVVLGGYSPESVANAANISYPVFAAVIEDGERLTLDELRGMQELIASHECAAHSAGCYDALSLDYLCSPALSRIYPDTNKGKFLRWKFEQMKAKAASGAYLTAREKLHAQAIGELLQESGCFYYAGYRQSMNELKSAIWKADSFRRIAEARKRDRERPARRERRFEREVTI